MQCKFFVLKTSVSVAAVNFLNAHFLFVISWLSPQEAVWPYCSPTLWHCSSSLAWSLLARILQVVAEALTVETCRDWKLTKCTGQPMGGLSQQSSSDWVKTCPGCFFAFHSLIADTNYQQVGKANWLINYQSWSESEEATFKWRTHNALPSACICVSLGFPVCATGSPPCPALLVGIISCPALAARVCAP